MSDSMLQGSEPDPPQQPPDFQLHLASSNSVTAKAWNVGLLLGVVSRLCHAARYDPWVTSLRGVHHFSGLLQSHACMLAETIPIRDSIVSVFGEFVHGIDSAYDSEWHAELLGSWRTGEIDTHDLRISTCEPPGLHDFQQSIHQIVPDAVKSMFFTGSVFGDAWIDCHCQLRGDIPCIVPLRSFVRTIPDAAVCSEVSLDSEWDHLATTLFVDHEWNMAEWREFMFQGGHCGDVWSQLGAVSSGIEWISRRMSPTQHGEDEPPVPSAVISEDVPSGNCVHVPQIANDGFIDADFLGISYNELARVVTREGNFLPQDFGRRALPWYLFLRLVRNREQRTNRTLLEQCWQQAGCSDSVDRNALERAIADLRGMISPLELTIARGTSEGYVLKQVQS